MVTWTCRFRGSGGGGGDPPPPFHAGRQLDNASRRKPRDGGWGGGCPPWRGRGPTRPPALNCTRAETPPATTSHPRLVRSQTDRRIAGVCGGLADYFDVDPTIVRLAWVVLSIVAGAVVFGVIAYAVAWFIIPPAPVAALHASPSTT